LKKIVYQLIVKEDNHKKPYITITRGKLGETYPIDEKIFENINCFITRNLKAQLEVWGFQILKK